MQPIELAKLIAVVAVDLRLDTDFRTRFSEIWSYIAPFGDYYSAPIGWFSDSSRAIQAIELVEMLELGEKRNEDFLTYLRCFCELHKRRRKYALILERQPLPTTVQVSPRALMEYSDLFPPEALASWLTWRKFFYDLDNRSAQETGYLFEPILAAAIGGESMSAKERVVRRTSDPSKGRQVDCWKIGLDGIPLAYELKLRVTIAASGQGRFAEELSFAVDCRNSGVTPILVVLDPTENNKLTELQAAYQRVGGACYIGDDAWLHLEQEAGPTMAAFIERYVRRPVDAVSQYLRSSDAIRPNSSPPASITATMTGAKLEITLGDYQFTIYRQEDPALAQDSESDES